MAEELLDDRVKKLEKTVQGLAELPAQVGQLDHRVRRLRRRVMRVEWQIVQLRTDMRVECSAVRREAGERRDAILEVIESSSKATQRLYDDGREEMRQLFRETHSQMRTLHEDLVSRIALIGKG